MNVSWELSKKMCTLGELMYVHKLITKGILQLNESLLEVLWVNGGKVGDLRKEHNWVILSCCILGPPKLL